MMRRASSPSTWQQALVGVLAASPGRPDDHPRHPAVEIAIYPDVVWLAAQPPDGLDMKRAPVNDLGLGA